MIEQEASRADPQEGTIMCWQAEGGELQVEDQDGIYRTVAHLTGQVLQSAPGLDQFNLYCLHGIRRSRSNQVLDLSAFQMGNTAVLITDFHEFDRRFQKAAEAAGYCEVYRGNVRYVHRDQHHGEMDLFTKFSTLAHQSEFRYLIRGGPGEALTLRLGSLADIAVAVRTDKHVILSTNAHVAPHAGGR